MKENTGMKKLLVALAIAVPLFIGMLGSAAAADRPTRDGEPWWTQDTTRCSAAPAASQGGPFDAIREYGRPQPGH